ANEDFLYVLSAMVLEPIRWNERFGWRPWLEAERIAQLEFWREIGRHMAIRDIPDTLDELDRLNRAYEAERFAATEAGRRLAHAQSNVFVDWFPWLPRQIGARGISALLDERVVEMLGLVRPTALERRAAEAALRARGSVLRALPPRRRPKLRTS